MTAFGIDELPVKPRMRGWIHLYAFGVSIVCGIVLVSVALAAGPPGAGPAVGIYALATCGLFGTSATYHRVHWRHPRSRVWMKRADHSMIFLFIAGSYTPFAVLGLPWSTGKALLIVVWAGALAGVALKMVWPAAPRWLGVPLYLLLGWAIVPVAGTLTHAVGVTPMALLLAGGIFYSIGGVLYATKWPDPWPTTFGHHEFFHAATVIAAICHYVAVWLVLLR
ncbi:PAQR family membrane homeostasis protein TrhA [Rhodococcoides corynebacterioides]|uniref:Hemolysin III family protein n=1 Tax=Rhodococcoides corynebacterioides TaxID=53972 RepID=A0ABS7NZL2_9NOCA|nr:hemolysin III family protein [Rhodococcus corynebacterioides]MBY6365573.1 hemolysin III family protein [Rhodococcus corynebacterioides]MBY6406304.1 hemolysin III family protein [Rhodococcus corynebacterioides]